MKRTAFTAAELARLASLEPTFATGVRLLLDALELECAGLPYHAIVVDGRRAPGVQAQRWAVGRRQRSDGTWEVIGQTVTNARPGSSPHEFGLAVDLALIADGTTSYVRDSSPAWARVGALALGCGLHWGVMLPGGRKDLGHVEAKDWRSKIGGP